DPLVRSLRCRVAPGSCPKVHFHAARAWSYIFTAFSGACTTRTIVSPASLVGATGWAIPSRAMHRLAMADSDRSMVRKLAGYPPAPHVHLVHPIDDHEYDENGRAGPESGGLLRW